MQYKLSLLTIILIISTQSFGQKDEVYENFTESFDFAKASLADIEDYYSYLKKCKDETFEDAKYYIRKAKNSIDDAKDKIDSAKSEAEEAKSEASDINCDGAESESDDAETNFNNASNNLDDAYTYLKRAEYADDAGTLIEYIKKAQSTIEDAIINIKSGMLNLNNGVKKLKGCN